MVTAGSGHGMNYDLQQDSGLSVLSLGREEALSQMQHSSE